MANKKNNRKAKKKKMTQQEESNLILTIIGIIVLVIIFLLIFRFTYAYFSANIISIGNNGDDAIVSTANLLVEYIDGSSNLKIGDKITPGTIISKNFSVQNKGTDVGYYAITLENVKNEFSRPNDISYTLVKIVDNQDTVIATGTFPQVDSIIYTIDNVKKDATNEYRLDVEYKNTSDDQSVDMTKTLQAKINIVESSEEKGSHVN